MSYLSGNINAAIFAKVSDLSKSNSSYLYVDFGFVNLGLSKTNFVNFSNLLVIKMILLTKCSHSKTKFMRLFGGLLLIYVSC